ncbi:hypothetical protein GQ457_05G009590 [Hibiscus cannabinus]
MGRSSSPPRQEDNSKNNTINNNDQGLYSIRDRFILKRNSGHTRGRTKQSSLLDRHLVRSRHRFNRKGLLLCPFRGIYLFYFVVIFSVSAFAVASMVMQGSITRMVFRQGGERGWRRSTREGMRFGGSLKFSPVGISRRLAQGGGLDRVRSTDRIGIRGPRLALILGNMKEDPESLMLVTMVKSLQRLGYVFKIYALEHGKAHSIWEESISKKISFLGPAEFGHVDWSLFEGVVACSLGAKEAISSLMQEPFDATPLIWIIQEDTLAKRLPVYEKMGLKHLVYNWKSAFTRANVIVFPNFMLVMLYSLLDTGNFHVIPGSPVDVWGAESYSMTHAKPQLREDNGFSMDDMVVVVVGSSLFYDELSWDYAFAMRTIAPLLMRYARANNAEGSFKFIFLSGNSTDGDNDALQQVASRLRLTQGSVRHFGFDGDANGVLLMADIVLYGSSQEEQGFPPLIIRAMAFGIPVITPDFPILKKYVVDGVDVVFFQKHQPGDLLRVFALFISNGRVSSFAQTVASSGRLLAKNILASECITGYASLLENLLNFPSDVLLPASVSELLQGSWEWNLFRKEMEHGNVNVNVSGDFNVVYLLEEEFTKHVTGMPKKGNKIQNQDILTEQDLNTMAEIENFENYERLGNEEVNERMERIPGVWTKIYRNARKSDKLKVEENGRNEGELERTGQSVCIYEIYSGAGAWPFLHHGSMYRGLSLSRRAMRLRSDDVDAVGRLPILNVSYYRDLLCEVGGMFSIANKVETVHKRPWIGFQSWRAAGRKVSLSTQAEKVIEEKLQENQGDVMYFWACLEVDGGRAATTDAPTFWSMCDMLNGGHCRTAFENAFGKMYALPSDMEALPPMPNDEGHWSALHSWVMPTTSFLEFVMFSRMFVDSLHGLHINSSVCLLGSSDLEKKHCYCRVLELLINVWAYHTGRRMLYIEPHSGLLEEQHPVVQRKAFMWAKYFNFTLLKGMDEDLAEASEDDDRPMKMWLWPLTGEVDWQGIHEMEREYKYRLKMVKKRRNKEKKLEKLRNGYKGKPLGL